MKRLLVTLLAIFTLTATAALADDAKTVFVRPPDQKAEALSANSTAPSGTQTETKPAPAAKEAVSDDAKPAPKGWKHPPVALPASGVAHIYVIPIHKEIGKTNKFILRRGLKEAISKNADVVIFDMDTPGGRADIMLEMMDMIDHFNGRTIAYINKEAMSAGALISASAHEIYFAPKSVIGAAAVISETGEDIPHTLKTKIDSYMDAKLRAITEGDNPRRADVIRAMMQEDYVLSIDGKTIKDKGTLLSRTSDEAMALYGNPPTPLLGSGIYNSVEDLARAEYGEGHYTIKHYEMTWSETAAMYLERVAPILMGLGFLALIVEFYTPGFGLPGITGIALLVIVFLSNYVAGLAGNEPLLVFAIGLLLVLVELFFIPGTMFLAITGSLMMIGSLIWSLADIWPKTGGGFEFDYSRVAGAAWQVILGIIIAIALFAILYRFLPKRLFFGKFVLEGASGNVPAAEPTTEHAENASRLPPVGSEGTAVSDLRPSGTVEIAGRQYEATLTIGDAERGQKIVVIGSKDFQLLVKLG
jgi:membrane-bound serine protease (ClpP class)